MMRAFQEFLAFCDLFLFFWLLIPAFFHATQFWDGATFRFVRKWKTLTWRKRRNEWGEWM